MKKRNESPAALTVRAYSAYLFSMGGILLLLPNLFLQLLDFAPTNEP